MEIFVESIINYFEFQICCWWTVVFFLCRLVFRMDMCMPTQNERVHLSPDLEQVFNNIIVVSTSSMRLQPLLLRRHTISIQIGLTIQFEISQNIWKILFP